MEEKTEPKRPKRLNVNKLREDSQLTGHGDEEEIEWAPQSALSGWPLAGRLGVRAQSWSGSHNLSDFLR